MFLDCAPLIVNLTLTKSQIEQPQPVPVASWTCNVDALTPYRLNSTLVTASTNILNAQASDFTANCITATNKGVCATSVGLSQGDPINRRGTGGNTAGTLGADFSGDIFVDVSRWDTNILPGFYRGTITFFVTDLTP